MAMNNDVLAFSIVDARRLALELIATLVNIKKTAAEQLLKRAEMPDDLIRRFLVERDQITGAKRSKREAGTVILEELKSKGDDKNIIFNIIKIGAEWSSFHLSQDEYKARAVSQKAKEFYETIKTAIEREQIQLEQILRDTVDRERRERNAAIRQESALLLAQFEQAAIAGEPQQRGYFLEDLLNRLFNLYGIPVLRAFRRNEGGEQIDAAFEMDGWHYLVECRWRAALADIHQLDGLAGKVRRSGRQTMGLFMSINGWSNHVVPLLKQNPDKIIFLMEGFDLRCVLDLKVDLRKLLKAKLSALNIEAEPHFSVGKLLH